MIYGDREGESVGMGMEWIDHGGERNCLEEKRDKSKESIIQPSSI